jgi:hypothetical protein
VPSRAAGLGADVLAGGEAHFNVYGSDKASYLIDVVARSSEAGTRVGTGSVSVTIRRCYGAGCSKKVTYTGTLPPGSFTVAEDLSSGGLLTSLFGRQLSISWGGPEGSVLPSYELTGDGPRAAVRLYQVMRAETLLLGKHCRTKEALVSRSVRADSVAPVTKPLPRTLPRAFAGLARGTC